MYIIGINGGLRLGYQDTSAVLIKDGEVISAIEEERLNRIKHAPGQLPLRSIQWLLEKNSLSIKDVDVVASHGSTWGDWFPKTLRDFFLFHFGHSPRMHVVHHHDAHAASTFYASGFNEAMILSIDGSGDGVSTQLAIGKGTDLKVSQRYHRPDSLGLFYSLFTQYCGYIRDRDEYKLMGLSSYGSRNAFDFGWLLEHESGSYHLNTDFIKEIKTGMPQPTKQEMAFNENFLKKLKKKRLKHEPLTQHYKDVAASAQELLEQVVIGIVRRFHEETGIRKLCLAGGVALNCVANQKLMNLDFIDDIYVQPASSDAGISLGAAYLAAAENGCSPLPMKSIYLGSSFSNQEIEDVLRELRLDYHKIDDPAEIASDLIAESKVIGWFQGAMEFGPRALGARSILANPAIKEMQDTVNRKIKFRESFRPFCPSVLEEDVHEFFSGTKLASPHMTITYDVKAEKENSIPAVTHVDGTARIQTVNQKQHLLYWELLQRLKKKTGIGVVLNTSFNVDNEPIVNSPRDAVATFYGSGMDALVIGNFLLTKG